MEELFQNTFEEYSQVIYSGADSYGSGSSSGGESIKFHRAMNYSIPSLLVDHVDSVMLAADFPPVNRKPAHFKGMPTNMRGSDTTHLHTTASFGFVTPDLLNSFYSINNNTGSSLVSQYVYASLGQTLSPSDLLIFQTGFNLPKQTITNSIGGLRNITTENL